MKKLNDSAAARWGALCIVAFTMMAAYYVNDVMAPLKSMLEQELGWSSRDFGFFTGAYSFLNVFCLMLIWGGLILDRFGIRFTGILAVVLMVAGTGVEYYSITRLGGTFSVLVASAGYSVFGVGAEVAGITVTKIIAKWFRGKELALAMGIQVALARVGSQAAYAAAIPMAKAHGLSSPLLAGLALLFGGMLSFLCFTFMDRKLDNQVKQDYKGGAEDDKFSFKDVKAVVSSKGFWLIALLCVLFYSCVFPFQKFATELMTTKYGVSESIAGTFAGLPALGALILTPVFGGFIDRRGKAASMMMLGSVLLAFVHGTYSLPVASAGLAVGLMVILGIAFSLVPSAMWPSVAKIFPVRQLGTAYALIFFIQNIGLWGVPALIGTVLDKYCVVRRGAEGNLYDYTLPMRIFTLIALLACVVTLLLKAADRKRGYGLEKPNVKG